MTYFVNFWGSHPDKNNDDCFTGFEFSDFEEALAFFKKSAEGSVDYYWKSSTAAVQLTSETDNEVLEIFATSDVRDFTAQKDDDDREWEEEQRRESRMLYGEDIY